MSQVGDGLDGVRAALGPPLRRLIALRPDLGHMSAELVKAW